MGGKSSKSKKANPQKEEIGKAKPSLWKATPDLYKSLAEVQDALQSAGLESSNRKNDVLLIFSGHWN